MEGDFFPPFTTPKRPASDLLQSEQSYHTLRTKHAGESTSMSNESWLLVDLQAVERAKC